MILLLGLLLCAALASYIIFVIRKQSANQSGHPNGTVIQVTSQNINRTRTNPSKIDDIF